MNETETAHYTETVANWKELAVKTNYGFNFTWLGRKICQIPEDIITYQELVWKVKPDLIIETGIAEGGSLLLSASMLALLDTAEQTPRRVIGIDKHIGIGTRFAFATHPLSKYITIFSGDSTGIYTVDRIREMASGYKRVMVCLDSDHSHEHVLQELLCYAKLTSVGSYCVVFDTSVEDLPPELFTGATCCRGNSPRTAVNEYLLTHPEFAVDYELEKHRVFTCAKGGWLKRIK